MTKPALALVMVSALIGCSHESVEPSGNTSAPNTARAVLGDATTFAQTQNADARLMSLGSLDVKPDGTSDTWHFKFRVFAPDFHDYYLHIASGAVVLDSTSSRTTEGDAFITQSWCNSDLALALAELSGGSQFRAAHPRSTISASVGQAVVPDPQTLWYIVYHSSDDATQRLWITIDAATMAVLRISDGPGDGSGTPPGEVVDVAMKNTDTFRYPTVGGDEEGALILRQALHYRLSEIQRNQSTHWIAVYVYQPEAGYVGGDSAEIEIRAGSDGASPPTRISRVRFRFSIAD